MEDLIYTPGFLKVKSTTTNYIDIVKQNIPDEYELIWNKENNNLYIGDGITTLENLTPIHIEMTVLDESVTLKGKASTILIKSGTSEEIQSVEEQVNYLQPGEPLYNTTLNTLQFGQVGKAIKDLPYIGTSIIDAPNDGLVYVRCNNTWKSINLNVN